MLLPARHCSTQTGCKRSGVWSPSRFSTQRNSESVEIEQLNNGHQAFDCIEKPARTVPEESVLSPELSDIRSATRLIQGFYMGLWAAAPEARPIREARV